LREAGWCKSARCSKWSQARHIHVREIWLVRSKPPLITHTKRVLPSAWHLNDIFAITMGTLSTSEGCRFQPSMSLGRYAPGFILSSFIDILGVAGGETKSGHRVSLVLPRPWAEGAVPENLCIPPRRSGSTKYWHSMQARRSLLRMAGRRALRMGAPIRGTSPSEREQARQNDAQLSKVGLPRVVAICHIDCYTTNFALKKLLFRHRNDSA
jgi:hypothetical protein